MKNLQITIIAAVSKNNVIGQNGSIPWHCREDLKHFSNTTRGHAIIMGRKTYDSIGKTLPNRLNIVITGRNWHHNNALIFDSLAKAILFVKSIGMEKVFLIGGHGIYKEGLEHANSMLITDIRKTIEVNDNTVFFPKIEKSNWKIESELRSGPGSETKYIIRKFSRT